MPRGDRTGPMGMGPMTGRAAGYCVGYPAAGYLNPGFGFGRGGPGRGFGRGWGRGWRFARFGFSFGAPAGAPYAAPAREEEAEELKRQAGYLEQSLAEIRERLAEIEKGAKSS
jgi:hypothetical protein